MALGDRRGADASQPAGNSWRVGPASADHIDGIARVCRVGFALSSEGLLRPETIERQSELYYDHRRVAADVEARPPGWHGYLVAMSSAGKVLGATGGGIATDGTGQVLVLYLDPEFRGRGIGTALLGAVTEQQQAAGADEQWVSVTEGNLLGIPFYEARGFVLRDRTPYVVGDAGESEAYSLRMSRQI